MPTPMDLSTDCEGISTACVILKFLMPRNTSIDIKWYIISELKFF